MVWMVSPCSCMFRLYKLACLHLQYQRRTTQDAGQNAQSTLQRPQQQEHITAGAWVSHFRLLSASLCAAREDAGELRPEATSAGESAGPPNQAPSTASWLVVDKLGLPAPAAAGNPTTVDQSTSVGGAVSTDKTPNLVHKGLSASKNAVQHVSQLFWPPMQCRVHHISSPIPTPPPPHPQIGLLCSGWHCTNSPLVWNDLRQKRQRNLWIGARGTCENCRPVRQAPTTDPKAGAALQHFNAKQHLAGGCLQPHASLHWFVWTLRAEGMRAGPKLCREGPGQIPCTKGTAPSHSTFFVFFGGVGDKGRRSVPGTEGGGVGTRPWWLALLACGGAYWPLAFEPSAMTSRHPYYCGGIYRRGGGGYKGRRSVPGTEGGGWHKASVSDCLPLAAPIGLSPLLILTLCGPERVLVVSTEPPDDLSCLTTPGVGRPRDGLLPCR